MKTISKGRKRTIGFLMALLLIGCQILLPACSSSNSDPNGQVPTGAQPTSEVTESKYKGKSAEEIVASLTLEEKTAQMMQGAIYNITEQDMKKNCYGSILSNYSDTTEEKEWKETVLLYQKFALESETGIPYVYGNDSVHGVNYCYGAVVFPQNIGVGAANDEALTYEMGRVVAEEIKLTGMLMNFAPCVAVATEPRWGRTYESFSSEPDMVKRLALSYSKGLIDHGAIVCAKHFLGDGSITYGTGEGEFLTDRGDASLTEEQLNELLSVYQALVDAKVQMIMVNHGSVNGVKLHEHKHLITDVLKGEMGFKGVVISDWESIHNISGEDLKSKIITAVNAGIDMLMEPEVTRACRKYLIEGVQEGKISEERINDAVTRIITMKINAGIMDDPMQKNVTSEYTECGSAAARQVAQKMVEESLVLLKNDDDLLPLKRGLKLYITGPAANDTGMQCGGWTRIWQGGNDAEEEWIDGGTTILEGFEQIASEYDLTIITDSKKAEEADATILCVGEKPYAEWYGDTKDLSLVGDMSASGNKSAIAVAKELGKPIVTLVVAGRQVILPEDQADWSSIVMCYLPGSEGQGVATVLTGKEKFKGKLPMPWYENVDDIKTEHVLYPVGYGLTY